MRFPIAYGFAFALSSAIAANVCVGQDESDLGRRLAALNHLRRGVNTPFEVIETEGQQLLEQYPGEEDQGRIYAELAHIYAQTGMRRPGDAQRVIDYAQKALQKPLDPALRLRSYLYWGNAHVRSDPSDVMRSALQGQLLFFYTRHPYAASELRGLATETLGDAGEVEKLMNLIPPHARKDEAPVKPK